MWEFLSYTLTKDLTAYKNGKRINIVEERKIVNGDSCNQTSLELPTHLGTHIDFPYHFDENGKKGDELLALNGGKKSIAKFRPIVQCELSNNFTIPRYNYSITDVYNYFNSLNYIYAYISKENALYESRGLEWSTGSFEKDANNSYEFFFIPNEMKSSIDLSTQFKNSILKPYAV